MSDVIERERALSPLQKMLWLLDHYRGGSGVMNVPLIREVRGALDLEVLGEAWVETSMRHEALRMRVERRRSVLTQIVDEAAMRPLEILAVGPVQDPEAASRAVQDQARREIDLAEGTARATVLRIDDDRHVVLVNVHHLVTDAWSNAVIWRDVCAVYNRRRGGVGEPLDPPRQFIDHLADGGDDGDPDVHRAFWVERIERYVPPRLRPVPPRAPRSSPPAANVHFVLDADEVAGLRRAGLEAEGGGTLFVTALSVFCTVLCAVTGRTDVALGSVFANRTRPDVFDTVGLFANMVILGVDLTGVETFTDVVSRVQPVVLEALEHQSFPYMTLPVGMRRSDRRLEELVFHMLPDPVAPAAQRLDGLEVSALPQPDDLGSRFDLELLMLPSGGRLEGVFRYAKDQFEPALVEELAARYRRVVAAVVEDPQVRIGALVGGPR